MCRTTPIRNASVRPWPWPIASRRCPTRSLTCRTMPLRYRKWKTMRHFAVPFVPVRRTNRARATGFNPKPTGGADVPLALQFLEHRKCCHGLGSADECQYWTPPLAALAEEAVMKASVRVEEERQKKAELGAAYREPSSSEVLLEEYTGENDHPHTTRWVDFNALKAQYEADKKQEAEMADNDQLQASDCVPHTNPSYIENVERRFQRLVEEHGSNKESRSATVVSLFGGLGSEIVAIKKLGLGISKIIYCEIDKVATHVFRTHHDDKYNHNLRNLEPARIEVVVEPTLWDDWMAAAAVGNDTLDEKLAQFLELQGPIDLIVGGPPCGEHSAVNAYRQGTNSTEGSYLWWMGIIVRKLERIQQEKWPQDPLFFLAENVKLSFNELRKVNEAFEFDYDPLNLDASYLSPVRRNRLYWSNIPVPTIKWHGKKSRMSVDCVLEPDMTSAAGVLGDEACVKANCLMSSSTRINDTGSLRTFVFKKEPTRIEDEKGDTVCLKGVLCRPLDILEREALMGFPYLYIIQPVHDLFASSDYGLMKAFQHQHKAGKNWRSELDPKFLHFAGNYHGHTTYNGNFFHFEIAPLRNSPHAQLKLAPPPKKDGANSSVTFLNSKDYSKRLVGNAFSVPVVAKLLGPLKKLFRNQQYAVMFDYDFHKFNRREEFG